MFIKRSLFALLSVESYLKLISSFFFMGYFSGLLRLNKKFALHYFAPRLLRKGDVVLDIGGNLGYYSILFAKSIGKSGRVIAVEPVTLFRKVFERNIRRRNWNKNITILPFALGTEDNKRIIMGVPAGNKYFRHGLTKVLNDSEQKEKSQFEFQETMMKPESLFDKLDRLDYIKCDVEGYEIHIFPMMLFLFEKFKPIIQIETDGENRSKIIELLQKFNYTPYFLSGQKLNLLTGKETFHTGDLLFFTPESKNKFPHLFVTDHVS